jgi:hypothetical protein
MTTQKRNLNDPVTIMINRWQRILRYGYPFDDIERQLLASGDTDLVRVTDAPFWWEKVIVNLRISEEEKPEFHSDEVLTDSLNELIERIAIELGLL